MSDELWKTLAKNKASVRLVNNQISNIPLDLIKANGSLQLLDIANNNLPATLPFNEADTKLLGISPEVTQGYYPQKQAIELNVVAKDNKVTIQPKDEKLTILNLLHWYRGRSEFYGGEGILQGLDKYKEFLSKQTKPMAELLKSDDYGRNWYIVTKVERIRGNEVKELSSTSVSNEDDKKLEISDADMKAGDKYRITKTLFEKNATNIDDKIVELQTTVEADVKKEEPKVEEKPQVTPEQPKHSNGQDAPVNYVPELGNVDKLKIEAEIAQIKEELKTAAPVKAEKLKTRLKDLEEALEILSAQLSPVLEKPEFDLSTLLGTHARTDNNFRPKQEAKSEAKAGRVLPNTGMNSSSTVALGLSLIALVGVAVRRKFSK